MELDMEKCKWGEPLESYTTYLGIQQEIPLFPQSKGGCIVSY